METLLKASIIITIFYLFYKFFLAKETFFNSIRWFFLIGILVAFSFPHIVIPIQTSKKTEFVKFINFKDIEQKPILVGIQKINNMDTNKKEVLLLRILTLFYFIGIILLFIKLIVEFVSIFRLIKNNTKEKIGGIIYVKIKKNISPFSFFNYIIYPENQYSTTDLEKIISHEKVHVKQFHTIDLIVVNLLNVFLWFLPFAWIYKKKLQENLEFIADKKTVENYDKKEYQYLLLKESTSKYPFALSNNFYQSLIKKRIIMLQKQKSKTVKQLKYLLLLPLLTIFLLSFNTKKIIRTENDSNLFKNFKKKQIKNEQNSELNNGYNIVIEKRTIDTKINGLVKKFALKNKVSLEISKIKRNKNNEIISIQIAAVSNNTNIKYHYNSTSKPMPTLFVIYDKKNGTIEINEVKVKKNIDKPITGAIKFKGIAYYYIIKDNKYKIYDRYGNEVSKELFKNIKKEILKNQSEE